MKQLHRFSRTELLFGEEALEKLKGKKVAVFGVGGVGGYVVEALARSGIGTLEIVDNDVVSLTNINRQIIATTSTIGKDKVTVAKERLLDINPELNVITKNIFFLPETANEFDFSSYDYVVDAVDTVKAKIEIVLSCQKANVPVISSMGTGNKTDPSAFRVADIYDTKVDPLAKVMRTELKKRKVKKLKVVYSEENPILPAAETTEVSAKRTIPGSTAFTPPVAGLLIASEVVKDLIDFSPKRRGE